jgi:succinyl-CoA synthetase beta subunit
VRLLEDQLKPLLAARGISVPAGAKVVDRHELKRFMGSRHRIVLKALVAANDRAAAGQVVVVTRNRAFAELDRLLAAGDGVWAEEYVEYARECFVGLVWPGIDDAPTLLTSDKGGTGVSHGRPVHRHVYRAGESLTGPLASLPGMASVIRAVGDLFEELAAIALEINPLVVTPDGRLLALDAKAYLDPYGRRSPLGLESAVQSTNPLLEFARLDGQVGVLSIGAGLTRAVIDWLTVIGPGAACFSDLIPAVLADMTQLLAGEAGTESIRASAWLCDDLAARGRRSLLINLVSATPIDSLSKSVLAGLRKANWQGRVAVHLGGNRSAEAADFWRSEGIQPAPDLAAAIAAA